MESARERQEMNKRWGDLANRIYAIAMGDEAMQVLNLDAGSAARGSRRRPPRADVRARVNSAAEVQPHRTSNGAAGRLCHGSVLRRQ